MAAATTLDSEMTTMMPIRTVDAMVLADARAWETLKEQSKIALRSKYLPKAIQNEEQAITIAMAGRELGVAPMAAFRLIHLIDGKITMAAELLLAMAYRKVPGFRCTFVKTTDSGCWLLMARPGDEKPSPFYFTIEDAQRAGLTGKANWKNYPAAMCRARAIAAGVRAMAPDATLGILATEEVIDAPDFHVVPEHTEPAQLTQATVLNPVDQLKGDLRARQASAPATQAAAAATQASPPPKGKDAKKAARAEPPAGFVADDASAPPPGFPSTKKGAATQATPAQAAAKEEDKPAQPAWMKLEPGEKWTDGNGVVHRVVMNERLGGKMLEPLVADADFEPDFPEPGSEG